MNGSEPKIEIFKPFGDALELMKRILFQPFDLKKWFVIGFAAFLANLGGQFNYNYNFNPRGTGPERAAIQPWIDKIHEIPHSILIIGITLIVLIVLAIAVVFAWLRARGRFMFIDCIVKNRGAIAAPWREYKNEGNSFFLFSLVVGFSIFILAALVSLPFILPILRGVTFLHLHDFYLISMIVLWAVVLFLLLLTWALIAHFMVTLMYCRRCRAAEGFQIALSLIARYPGEITLYCLFWIVLAIGAAFVGCIATCATCCIVIIPYIGTVILLPVFVCLRSFGLLFLRQFGTGYDVWQGADPLLTIAPPLPPAPPPAQA